MRLLFLAPIISAFGEALHGVRIARRLAALGHEIVFLAPARMHTVIGDAPVLFGRIDLAIRHLDRQLAAIVRKQGCDAVVLIDLAAVGKLVNALELDVRGFTEPGVPVVALDCWALPPTPVEWDYGPLTDRVAPELHAIDKKLVTVPIGKPDVAGGFDAMPKLEPLTAAARARVRDELGIAAHERMILWPSASWQHPEIQGDPVLSRLCGELPVQIAPALAALGRDVRVVHVGRLPFAGLDALRYQHLEQVPPPRFEALLGAADLLLSFNVVGSSVAAAVAARLPIVLGGTPTMRAWPLSLQHVLAPTLDGNPYLAAMDHADPFDPDGLAAACHRLLFDPAAADAQRARHEAYHRTVAQLPGGAERLLELVTQPS